MYVVKKHLELCILAASLVALIVINVFFLLFTKATTEANDKEAKKWTEMQGVYREQLVNAEDCGNIDSLVNVVRCNQIFIIDRQADLINDLRQETNNLIDKLNLWLAYTIGLISIIGVFVPLCIQYFKNKQYDSEFQEIKNEFRDLKTEGRNNIDELIKIKDKIPELISELQDNAQKQIEKEIRRFNGTRELIEMRSAFITLSLGIQQRLTNNQPERERLLHYLWKNAVDAFAKVVKFCLKENDTETRRAYLVDCLIQISGFINTLKGSGVSERIRKWDKALDDIRYLIYQINYGYKNELAWEPIENHLNNLLKDLNQPNFFDRKV